MANETKISSLIDPQVIGDMVETKYTNLMVFGDICEMDDTLVGRSGDTLSLPQYSYIGDAEDVAELAAIPIAELVETMQDVKVKKAGKGIVFSDEALLSGHGDPLGEGVKQLGVSIASKQDNDAKAQLDNATFISPCVSVTPNAINEALVKFGEDLYVGDTFIYVSPATYSALRSAADWIPASQLAAEVVTKGVVGMVYGCYVKITNKISTTDTAYIVKKGAVRIINKRGVEVEIDRDVEHKGTLVTIDKHYVAYLYNPAKVIKMGAATLGTLTLTQTTDITSSKAKVKVTDYPTNLPYGWKSYYATNLNSATSVAVGDAYSTISATFNKAYEGEIEYAATNDKYFQVVYVDADNKIRSTGNVKLATSIAEE